MASARGSNSAATPATTTATATATAAMNAHPARNPGRAGVAAPRMDMLNRALPVAERLGGRPDTAAPARVGNVSATPMPSSAIAGSITRR